MISLPFGLSSLSILVVDDEPSVLLVLRAMLEAIGHVVGAAKSGEEGLVQFRLQHWDLVMTDRAMPGMGGEEFAEAIKTLSPRTPVVMVTGMTPPQSCAAIDAIVRKPCTRPVLSEAIARCMAAYG